jgi:DNA-binding transcriptional LysR family regulator
MDDITIKQIKYFIAAAECQNFTEAAQKLYVSQPAISKWISRLEVSIGLKLFKRNKYGVSLTESGQILYHEWSRLLEEYYESLKKAGADLKVENHLIIGCLTPLKNDNFLNAAIKKFEQANPEVPIMIEVYEFKDLRENLVSGAIDLAFAYSFDFEKVYGVSQKILSKAEMFIALSKNHPLANQGNLRLIDFKDDNFYLVSPTETISGGGKVFEACRRAGFTPKNVKYVPNFSSLELLLQQGKGVAMCGKHVSKEFEDSIRLIPIDPNLTENYISLAWRTDSVPALAMQFLDFVKTDLDG